MSESAEGAFVDALNAEYAAVYAYGLIGGKTEESAMPLADSAIAAHRAARDRLRNSMAAAGWEIPPPAAAYDTGQITDAAGAAALAVNVELAAVPRYAALTAQVAGQERGWCATQAQQCATRAMAWGATSSAFPGITVTTGVEQ
jgi:hypothetical protein